MAAQLAFGGCYPYPRNLVENFFAFFKKSILQATKKVIY
jgi:hypothetical protein